MSKPKAAEKLSDLPAKRCLIANALLWYQGRSALIHHKKLDCWLAPGGHMDPNELLHQTAERECFEETGIKVKTISADELPSSSQTEYLPLPLTVNLHWVSQQNYFSRMAGATQPSDPTWQRGCEQHYGFLYLVVPLKTPVKLHQNTEETLGIAWFTPEQALTHPQVHDNIKLEMQMLLNRPNLLTKLAIASPQPSKPRQIG